MCTANPIAVEDETKDLSKMFSASELQRAANAGVSDKLLIDLKSLGLTFEETIKYDALIHDPEINMKNVSQLYILVGIAESQEIYVVVI